MIWTVPASVPYMPDEDRRDLQESLGAILTSGRYILGPHLEQFETAWAKRVGRTYAIGFSSATAAMTAYYSAWKTVQNYVRVHVSVGAFVANYNAPKAAGIKSISVHDIEGSVIQDLPLQKFCNRSVDVTDINIYNVTHFAGIANPLLPEFSSFKKYIFEDCSHAHCTRINETLVGKFGHAAVWSFYPTKILASVGNGGVIATDSPSLAGFLRRWRHHGQDSKSGPGEGSNALMSEIVAASLVLQLRREKEISEARKRIAQIYRIELPADYFTVLKEPVGIDWVPYKLPILVPDMEHRNVMVSSLRNKHIEAAAFYDPPLLEQFAEEPMERAANVRGKMFAPPLFPSMSDTQLEHVIKTMKGLVC